MTHLAAIEQFLGDDVAEMIAAARAEARERVRPLLVDAMSELMLDRARTLGVDARTGRGPAARADEASDALAAGLAALAAFPEAQPGPARASEPTGFYVYCVVSADTEIPAGLEGSGSFGSPALIRHERLAAVVSAIQLADFDEDRMRERAAHMDRLERTGRTHERVLEAIGKRATLVPMRLGTVFRSDSAVIEMLWRETPALLDALEHLDGKSEWGLKAYGSDHIHKKSREAERQLKEMCATIHDQLAELAAAAVTSPRRRVESDQTGGQILLDALYLVENDRRDSFLGLVDALHAEHASMGLRLETSGPCPAYNFVPGTIGAPW